MKLEVGMYVRHKYHTGSYEITKINKIIDVLPQNKQLYLDGDVNVKSNVIKASNNIIDLIEVGDYVNGYKVHYCYCADEDSTGLFIDTEKGRQWLDKPIQIKLIVTKEQFESMQYEVD